MARDMRIRIGAMMLLVLAGCDSGTGGAMSQLDRLPCVEGQDANSDGVRDDIEHHLFRKYTDPMQRKSAMQTERAYQQMLLVAVSMDDRRMHSADVWGWRFSSICLQFMAAGNVRLAFAAPSRGVSREEQKTMKAGNQLAICTGLVILTLALAGCGGGKGTGGDSTHPAGATPLSDQEKIAQLEASGAIPKLERLPSVEGQDANTDGVRDDIESHIFRKYSDLAQRKAAMQMARAYQQMLLVDKTDALALERVSTISFRAIACLNAVFTGTGAPNSSVVRTEIRALTTNTKERLQAYLSYNKARSGSTSTSPEGNACE